MREADSPLERDNPFGGGVSRRQFLKGAALGGERLWRLELDENGAVSGREHLLDGEYGRIRNAARAPTAPCG